MMLSRVAEAIYWMSRYIERAENIARFIEVNLNLTLDLPRMPEARQWMPLVTTTGDEEFFNENYEEASEENVIEFLTFNREYLNSIISCVRLARENARSVRETISSEMWEEINRFYQFLVSAQRRGWDEIEPHQFFMEVKRHSHLIVGISEATMTHGLGWHFARMGRMIERADKTSRMLDVKYFILLPQPEDVGTPLDVLEWSAVLRSASALEMYRKKYQTFDPLQIVEFLVLDQEFPRAMHHCLIKSEDSMRAITGSSARSFTNRAEQRIGRLRSRFDYTTVDEIIEEGLHEFLDSFQAQLNGVGEAIFETFFDLSLPAAPARKPPTPPVANTAVFQRQSFVS